MMFGEHTVGIVDLDDVLLAHVAPIDGVEPAGERWTPGAIVRLSRFATISREGDELRLTSPIASAIVHLRQERMLRVLCTLASPFEIGSGDAALESIVAALGDHNFLEDVERSDRRPLDYWEPHDLTFHRRSRSSEARNYGATMRFAPEAPPDRAARGGGDRIMLDIDDGALDDVSLRHALERRRSVRRYATEAITLRELSTFLEHSMREQSSWLDARLGYERSRRPYPSAGAVHPLELYVVVERCAGLEPGVYRYDPRAHALSALHVDAPDRDRLMRNALKAAPLESPPQLLLVITARFGGMQWRYEAMAYASILKELGALMQTMYLVATALDLSACALGGGDSRAFAAATGADELAEGSVGEMLLGS